MKLERGVPPKPPTPDEIMNRLDAEAEAFMKEHAETYAIAVEEALRGTHVEPAPWHEENIRRHWPELWSLWNQYRQARSRLIRHVLNARQRYGKA